jgi:dihydropteroate synthase
MTECVDERVDHTLTFAGKSLPLGHRTIVMGILNVTPDSFSDGGRFHHQVEAAVDFAHSMLEAGATIIDIGGESTRPGASRVELDEELDRVLPVLTALRRSAGSQCWISIDTTKAEVARQALAAGADLINHMGPIDRNPELARVLQDMSAPVIIGYNPSPERTLPETPQPTSSIVARARQFFAHQLVYARTAGLAHDRLLVDPGLGFQKKPEESLELVRSLAELASFGLPVVIGVSRKGHLARILQMELGLPERPGINDRLEAALAETAVAVLNGASVVRTHDVPATVRFLAMLDAVRRRQP